MKVLNFAAPAVVVLSLFGAGCATKKHVREAIGPIQNQVGQIDKKTGENTSAIGDLDRKVATADEKAMDADKKAGQAGEAARQAGDKATQAGQRADSANALAQQGLSKTGELQHQLENLDNYKLVTTEKVLFRVNRSELSKEAKSQLDAAIQSMSGLKGYVIEVEGFADKSGTRAHNLTLSEKRAGAVVRYLTVNHDVPLRKIHVLGAGSEAPNMDNHNRAARKENRRVEVKVYSLDMTGTPAQQSASKPTAQ